MSSMSLPEIYYQQGHRVKIRAPGQSGHGPSHIEQLRAQYIYFHKLTMLTVGPAGPLKVAGPLGICPPAPPLSAGLYISLTSFPYM